MVGDCLSYHYKHSNYSCKGILTGEMFVVKLYQTSLSPVTPAYMMLLAC